MKRLSKIINIVATSISVLSVVAVVILVAIFSSPVNIDVSETILTVETIEITRRKTNERFSYYAAGEGHNAHFYLVVAFELFDIENHNIHLTVNEPSMTYIININDNQLATIVYG